MKYFGWWTAPHERGRRGRRVARGQPLGIRTSACTRRLLSVACSGRRSPALPSCGATWAAGLERPRGPRALYIGYRTGEGPDRPRRAPTSSSVSAAGTPSSARALQSAQCDRRPTNRVSNLRHETLYLRPGSRLVLMRGRPYGRGRRPRVDAAAANLDERAGSRTGGRVTTCRASGRFAGEKCGLVTFYAVGER